MRRIAIFDFDGTLVTGDSLPCFVAACAGWPRTLGWAAFAAAVSFFADDRRTIFKALWLRHCLAGYPAEKLPQAIANLQTRLRWLPQIRDRLLWHKSRGDIVAVASGGLDLYLPDILHAFAVDHLLCTGMAVADGCVTGELADGNCVRAEKARRVAALLAATGPYEEIWAYGNAPHDLPMMELATHKIIV